MQLARGLACARAVGKLDDAFDLVVCVHTGDVEHGDGHATLLIEAVDWPEWKGMSFILSEDNHGFKDVQVFPTEELAQAAFDNWITDDEEEEEING